MIRIFIVLMSLVVLSPTVVQAGYDPAVEQAQQNLDRLGYQPGPIDGYWGIQTAAAIKSYQRDQGISETGQLDKATREKLGIKAIKSTQVLEGHSGSCPTVNVKVPPEGLQEISKMPDGTIFYMSKTNRFKSLSEVKDGEFGVWGTDMQYHLAVNVKFGRSTPWDKGRGLGGGHWKKLFIKLPELKLFVTQLKYELHEVICETGGGLRIKFVTE